MKKIALLVISVILLLSTSLHSFAQTYDGTHFLEENASWYAEEMAAVESAVRASDNIWDQYLGNERDKVSYPYMYQIYYLEMKDIISSYEEAGNFRSNISDKYYWVVPSYDMGGEVQVVRSDQNVSGWDIRRGTFYHSQIKTNYPDACFEIADIYNNIFAEYPAADKDSFRLVYEEETDVHLMYFSCERSEYLVPYFPSVELTWAVNGKIYPAMEYIGLMRENVSQESSVLNKIYSNQTSEKIYVNYILIGSVAVVCVAVVAIFVAKKKKKTNEENDPSDKS